MKPHFGASPARRLRALPSRFFASLLGVLVAGTLCATLQSAIFAQDSAPASAPASAAKAPRAEPETPVVGQKGSIPTTSFFGIVAKGGLMMYPIIASSVVLFVFVFERALVLRRGRVIPAHFVKRVLHQIRERQLTRDQAIEVCQENHSPIAEVFAYALRKWGRPAVEVEQAILDSGERLANQLRKNLRFMNGVATVAPLMGLLGTVTGMIAAFNAISSQQGMGRPELLASGISEALITTATGLCVAIPALSFYMLFVGRVDGLAVAIDEAGQELVNLISAEALAAAPPKAKSTKTKQPAAPPAATAAA